MSSLNDLLFSPKNGNADNELDAAALNARFEALDRAAWSISTGLLRDFRAPNERTDE